jgi:hypothetical protein
MSDLYKGSLLLADYLNEYANVSATLRRIQREKGVIATERGWKLATEEDFRTAISESPIRTVEDRFRGADAGMMKEVVKFPETVARLNQVAAIANGGDLITFKRARNEMDRLLHGKDTELNFPEPEFNPNLLQI